MSQNETSSNQANNLRRQAEEKAAKMTENLEGLSPVEIRQILYELRAHQIELEMQNEVALRESEKRFRKLFKSHAAIKLVIDPETGIIIDANEAVDFPGSGTVFQIDFNLNGIPS